MRVSAGCSAFRVAGLLKLADFLVRERSKTEQGA